VARRHDDAGQERGSAKDKTSGAEARRRRTASPRRLELAGTSLNRSILLSPVQDMLRAQTVAHSPPLTTQSLFPRDGDTAWDGESAAQYIAQGCTGLDDSLESSWLLDSAEKHPIQFSVRTGGAGTSHGAPNAESKGKRASKQASEQASKRASESAPNAESKGKRASKRASESGACELLERAADRKWGDTATAAGDEECVLLRELKDSVARALEGLDLLMQADQGEHGTHFCAVTPGGGAVSSSEGGGETSGSARASMLGSSSGGETRRSEMDTHREIEGKGAAAARRAPPAALLSAAAELEQAHALLREERARAREREHKIHELQVWSASNIFSRYEFMIQA
jgi:hypothetical protein